MRFHDPKTGEVFDTIKSAIHAFQCPEPYHECPIAIRSGGCGACLDGMWWSDHPVEAAHLMGYEVIEDEKEANMEKMDKPRLAEMLGVNEDEQWDFPEMLGPFRIHQGRRQYKVTDSEFWCDCKNEEDFTVIINHPESIIRAPRLTEEELERCRVYGAKWVTKNRQYIVELWGEKPEMNSYGAFVLQGEDDSIASVQERFFPSVHPGDCICVEEAGRSDD